MDIGGLLGNWGKWTGNPEQDSAISQGLLSAGIALMGGRGRLGPALSQAAQVGLGAYQQQMANQIPNKLAALKLRNLESETKRSEAINALPQQFYRSPEQTALAGGGGPTNANAQKIGAPSFDMRGYASALAQYDPVKAAELTAGLDKTGAPVKVSAGDSLVNPTTGEAIYTSPKTGAPTDLSKLLAEFNQLPPGDPARAIYMDAIRKATTHSPQVQVSYGQPVAGVDANGNSVFFQPSKDGQSPPAIVQGVKPAPQNRDTKLPAELQRMQIAGDSMVDLLDQYEGLLKKHNPRDPFTQMNPTVRADIESVKRNMELQFKELQALGALAGPDVEIMRQALADPFSMKGAFYGKDGLLAQTKRARELVASRKAAVLKSQGQSPQTPSGVLRYNPATGKLE